MDSTLAHLVTMPLSAAVDFFSVGHSAHERLVIGVLLLIGFGPILWWIDEKRYIRAKLHALFYIWLWNVYLFFAYGVPVGDIVLVTVVSAVVFVVTLRLDKRK